MNTKKTRKTLSILGWLVLALFTALFASCSLTGESIRDRIETFINAINAGDEQGIKDCLDPAATFYNTADSTFWYNYFPDESYSISDYSESGNTATVTFSNSSNTTLIYIFEMTEQTGSDLFSGKTYLIRRIRASSSSDYFFE